MAKEDHEPMLGHDLKSSDPNRLPRELLTPPDPIRPREHEATPTRTTLGGMRSEPLSGLRTDGVASRVGPDDESRAGGARPDPYGVFRSEPRS